MALSLMRASLELFGEGPKIKGKPYKRCPDPLL